MKKIVIAFLPIFLSACASGPQVVVDPQSITDQGKYSRDMAGCKVLSERYDLTDATAGSALTGAGIAVGTIAAILATGGLYLLPAGIAVAGGTGAAVGGGISQSKETQAREKIWAECLKEKGYKAYTSK